MIHVLIADDHTLVRTGIRLIIEQLDDFEVIAESEDGYDAIEKAFKLSPDILLIDIAMPRLNGLEAIERILRDMPKTRVIVLSMHASEQYIQRALQLGASGYLLKKSATEEIELAFKAVLNGDTYLSPPIANVLVNNMLKRETKPLVTPTETIYQTLTPRERETLQLVAEGLTNQEIATHLSLSVHTIRTHRGNLMEKLDLHSQAEVAQFAIEAGIIQPDD